MGYTEAGIPHEQLNIKLNYCTSEKEWNELKQLLNIDDKDKNPELDFSSKLTSAGEKINEAADNVKDTLVDAKDIATKVVDWVSDFGKNPFGTILSTLMDFLGEVGDAIQWLANTIQMNESNKVKYTYNFLKDKNGTGKDQYTRVGKYESGAKVVTGVDIKKDMNENNSDDFSKDTKIPVMVGDLYNVAVGHIDFLDVDFLTGMNATRNNKAVHKEGSAWAVIRGFAASVIHITLYVASAILIISLIWFGVKTIKTSLDNPSKRAEYKEGLERFEKSLLMLIGSILIMALCIFGTKGFVSTIEEDNYELPIRVNVEDTYSFSTTATGYVRYLSMTEDVDEWLLKTGCTLTYLVLTILNLAIILIMIGRVFALWGLSMIGPIIAAMHVFKKEGFMSFGTWTELYICISMIQVVIAIVYQLILRVIVV